MIFQCDLKRGPRGNKWHRLPACDCAEHRLEAYATLSVRHLFFDCCLLRRGFEALSVEVEHRSVDFEERIPQQCATGQLCRLNYYERTGELQYWQQKIAPVRDQGKPER